MIRLDKLSEHLKESSAETIELSFSQIEDILGQELPTEAKETAKWWWNVKGSKKARSWLDYGYSTFDQKNILARKTVFFRRNVKEPDFQKGFSRIWYFLTDKDAELHQKTMAVLEIFVVPIVTILTLIVAIATLYTTMFPTKSQEQIREDFLTLVSEGDYALENRDFLEAAGYYRKASLTAYDVDSAAYSTQREGVCYMLYGLIESNKDYQKRALMIYENMIDTPEYKNTENYQEAIIDLCYLYRLLDYDWQGEKWSSIVEQLETMFNFDDLENISEEDMPTFISAAVNLGYYYKTALFSNMNMLLNEEYQKKAIYYSKAATQLQIKYDKYSGVKEYDQTYLISIYELTSYMITNAFTHPKDKDNLFEILEEARTLCQDAILTIRLESGNMDQINFYTELKRNIGKAYIFSSWASESPDKENYMLKAYQELISLFYWDDYTVSDNIIFVSEYLLLTERCTEDDIHLILEKFSSHLQAAREKKNIPAQIDIELSALRACDSILLHYDYETISFNAQDFGQQIYTDLNTSLFDFLDSNQKAILSEYSEKFGT